jgi:hypothetical protein
MRFSLFLPSGDRPEAFGWHLIMQGSLKHPSASGTNMPLGKAEERNFEILIRATSFLTDPGVSVVGRRYKILNAKTIQQPPVVRNFELPVSRIICPERPSVETAMYKRYRTGKIDHCTYTKWCNGLGPSERSVGH